MAQDTADTAQELQQNLRDNLARVRAAASRGKPISTRTHGLLEYVFSPVLAFAPQALGFPSRGLASALPRIYGAASMVYGPMTRYELGLEPRVSMSTHLWIDTLSSIALAASPWLLAFGKWRKARTWLPHVALGIAELAIVALSDTRPKE